MSEAPVQYSGAAEEINLSESTSGTADQAPSAPLAKIIIGCVATNFG